MFKPGQITIGADSTGKFSMPRQEDSQTRAGKHIDLPPGTSYTYPLSPSARRARAWRDIVNGAKAYRIWGKLPLAATLRSFRQTIIGPYLPLFNRSISIALMALLFGKLLDFKAGQYIPHFVVGFIVWRLLDSVIKSGCDAFGNARAVIHATDLPLSVHVYEAVWSAFIQFALNVALIVVIGLFFGVRPGWAALVAVPGLAFIGLNGLWAGLLLGSLSPSFGALRLICKRGMRIAFFATPIIWMAHQFPNREALIQLNPLFHFVELVRGPLLGNPPSLASWLFVAGITVAGWLAAFAVFSRCRGKIAYLI